MEGHFLITCLPAIEDRYILYSTVVKYEVESRRDFMIQGPSPILLRSAPRLSSEPILDLIQGLT